MGNMQEEYLERFGYEAWIEASTEVDVFNEDLEDIAEIIAQKRYFTTIDDLKGEAKAEVYRQAFRIVRESRGFPDLTENRIEKEARFIDFEAKQKAMVVNNG